MRVTTCRLTEVLSRLGASWALHIVSPLHLHKGLSGANKAMLAAVRRVPHSAVSSVGFVWGASPGPGLVGILWGRAGGKLADAARVPITTCRAATITVVNFASQLEPTIILVYDSAALV